MFSFKRWYEGETKIIEFDQDYASGVVIMPAIYTDYHWTAKIARAGVRFCVPNWQFLLGTIIGMIGLYLSYKGLK